MNNKNDKDSEEPTEKSLDGGATANNNLDSNQKSGE
jgi:hypothetical protein